VVDAGLGVGIELVAVGLQPGHQLLAVAGPVVGAAEGVELQGQATHAQVGQQVPGHGDRLHIAAGIGKAEQLQADLVKLALAARLGALVAEHRPAIPEPLRPLAEQAVLDRRPHHRGRALRPQGAAALAAVEEGVHLLAHHIGGLADAAGKQLGDLQQRRADLLDRRPAEVLPRRASTCCQRGVCSGSRSTMPRRLCSDAKGDQRQVGRVCLATVPRAV
jgi:hypothetical protein